MKWSGIVVHHSASGDVSIDKIREWHLARGFRDVGYHFVISQDGYVEQGRNLNEQGAHARGRNRTHIGICLTGCFNSLFRPEMDWPRHPSKEQLSSLKNLLITLTRWFDIHKIERHHKACPGRHLDLEKISKEVLK